MVVVGGDMIAIMIIMIGLCLSNNFLVLVTMVLVALALPPYRSIDSSFHGK